MVRQIDRQIGQDGHWTAKDRYYIWLDRQIDRQVKMDTGQLKTDITYGQMDRQIDWPRWTLDS